MAKAKTSTTGDVVRLPVRVQSNAEALEVVLESLPVLPNPALVALARTMAEAADEGAGAAAWQQYREVLAELTEALPPERDILDKFNE